MEEFKCLGVLFMSEGKMEHEVDSQISAASAIMWALYWIIVMKNELSQNYVPSLIYGQKLWVVTERMRLWIQVAKLNFL